MTDETRQLSRLERTIRALSPIAAAGPDVFTARDESLAAYGRNDGRRFLFPAKPFPDSNPEISTAVKALKNRTGRAVQGHAKLV